MLRITKTQKTVLSVTAAFMLSALAFAEKGPVYISPNNDGKQDILEVPVKIKDKRYVKDWAFIIENDKGDVVRTIGNKEKRETKITFKTFWKALFTPKSGVTVPASVMWNGVMDNGEVAPDGTYYYYMTASDDNGNAAKTKKLTVIVDNTPPDVQLAQPSSNEKIFGEGAKPVLAVKQNGSEEDEWKAAFTDSTGKVVRSYKWTSSSPLSFEWNGSDDAGAPLPDGVYSYKITATDRAGNDSNPASIANIIYSADKPATNIAISGSKYFSPNGNGINDTISFFVKIPVPDAKSVNKLVEWAVKITDGKGNVVKTFSGKDNPPSRVEFDGKTDSGSDAAEGLYQAVVSAKYSNGYEPDLVKSPEFTLDKTPPAAKIKPNSLIFSPDGDGNSDTMVISQDIAANSGSPVENWTGKIVDSEGKTIREFDFGSFPPETVVWDGLDDSSSLAANGKYRYILSATDLAGNSSETSVADLTLDTSKTELLLAVSPTAFNPAGADKSKTSVKLTPVVKAGSSINEYTVEIKNVKGSTVWSMSGTSLPASFTWNGLSSGGERCDDGKYVATLSTKSANGSEAKTSTQAFVIDTLAPKVSVSAPYTLFSPDGDSRKDTLPLTVESSSEEKWTASIYDSKNQLVRSYNWQGKIPAKVEWNGTDAAGNKVADGTYRIVFLSEDAAGNKGSAEIASVQVDNREAKAYITAELDAFSPNGDSFLENQKLSLRPSLKDGVESWSVSIVSPEGKVVKSWSEKDQKDMPAEITWNGLDSENKVAEGIFTAKLSMVYAKGNVIDVSSSAFICSVTPPQLTVKTAPQYFSPDNDGENDDLYILLKGNDIVPLKNWSFTIKDPNGKPFWSTSGKSSITERIIWDGRGKNGELVQSATDYPYTFTVTDTLGMTSTVEGKIEVDILVIRVGDVLKMAVPSIIFRQDKADFGVQVLDASGKVTKPGITEAQAKNNERILKRIAQILNKFKNYTVVVEGHANSVTGTEAEETSTANGNIPLEPLSKERAEFVKGKLVGYGVSSDRLSAVGRGGRQPVAARGDKDNAWKNRRVEFILNK
ncbi:FlgD immunoglobulin-like domain containing protein [Treponema sp.]|uniref:FlgD immunoglobulin-like domain containing protein n=1 Tax=Treponema sp. TaxID=166 RepID=UPI0025F842B2|nr:FlgD immunoglobulin-like domain containing protein [Treponema sp.]MBR4321685.1 OmpA family protein [Treponema sp.]